MLRMTERKQLFLFGHALPGNGQPLIDRIQGCFKHHNSFGSEPVKALNKISADNIKQMVVGPSHICFLFESGQVGRLAFDIEEAKLGSAEKSSGNPPSGSNAAAGGPGSSSSSAPGGGPSSSSGSSVSNAYSAAASRTAKFRRVMMAARRPAFGERAGVIVDRARPLVPASQIPEELIAQAQVVLQGKSREVIVRELQRTNMNVNEAVNNLLSRDDDEGDDGGEQYLPEELLSLLDAGLRSEAGGAALIDADAFYSGSDFDYLVARDAMSRRRGDKDKKDKGKDGSGEAVQQQFVFDDHVMFWAGSERAYPSNVQRFTYIAPTYSQLFALADNGHMYAWKWDETQGQTEAHPRSVQLLGYPAREERIETFTTSSWRVVVRTNKNRVGTFLDDYFGIKMQSTMNFPLQALPDTDAKIISIHACSSLAVARTTDGIYWCGMYPYNERRKNWDRMKSRNKKHVTFDVNEITVGSEVRTKSHPIYLAGSVAINFSTGTPMVGVLMESGWTLDELCRFRLYTPEQYDSLNVATVVDPKAANFNISVRKRAAPSDESSSAAPSHGSETAGSVSKSSQKESAWSLNEVVFIHEEKFNDTAIVKLIDGAYCAVVYKRQDGSSNKESDDDVSKLRLLRKDELVLVSPNKTPRSPESFQRSFAKIPTPEAMTGSRVSSIVVDDTGVRLLCEKRARHHLLRVSVSGKLFSDHILPWNNAAFEGCGKKPEVTNYGDEFFLMIRDGNGSVVPMLRNAVGGYREPAYMGASNVRQFAIGVRHMETPFPNFTPTTVVSSVPFLAGTATKSTGTAKTPTRLGITVMLVTPQASSKNDTKALNVEDPSLMQVIMHADIRALDQLLSRYGNCKDDAFLKKEILDARADGNRTIIHAAVMNAFATNNKDQADTDNISLTKLVDSNAITKAADDTKKSYDDKWNKMIAPTKLADQTNEIAEYISAALDDSDPRKLDAEFNAEETVPTAISICPVNEAKARQLNSIEILKKLLCHNAIQHYLEDLLSVKDILGYTPLLSAINYRAYTAAAVIFNSLQNIYAAGRSRYSSLTDLVLPPGGNTRIDDSPLFMLCYNDTCSFTWTGEEHINQDIFECRTCGLVGSLCCCTECAYTCHRNHDCKLKRTSPTAYCDCWEKCPCKALAAGNQNRREWLWGQLIEKTNLVHKLNSRGEHIMLFLARTVGRQSQEQGAFSSKRRKPPTRAGATTSAESPNFPDHDLEPPKFARQALSQCLGNWKMVRSLLIYGIKSVNSYDDAKITDDSFHLFSQHGSSQLDKFTFTLLSKCTEEHLDVMLATLIQELNTKNEERDPDIVKLVSRFIRSVTRCFTLVVSSSASAAAAVFASLGANCSTGTLASSRSQSSASLNSNPLADAVGRRIGGVTLSGLMQIVRSSAQPSQKELRKRNITAIVLKCRRVFQTLPTISAIELANCADSVIAPVCLGVVKPTYHVAKGSGTSDVLDQIEKHLNSEHDLSAAFTNAKSDESVPATPGRHRRRRIGSRRDTERERDERENGVAVVDESEEYDSDSDGEAQSSRRLYSQSSAAGVEEVVSESVERVAQDFNAMDEERLSSDSITSISDDDDDDDNDDDDGDDDDDLMDADDDNQAVEDGYEDENVDDEEDDDADNAEDEEEDEGEDNGFNFRGNEDEASAGTDAMDVGEASESDRQGSAEARQEDAAPADGSSSTDAAADASGSDRNSNQEPLEVVVDDDDTIDNAPQLASDPPRSQRRQNTSSSSRGAAVRQRHAATRQTPSLLALASRDTTRRRGRTNTVAHTEDQGSILAPPSLTWAVRHVDFGNGSSSSRSFDRLFGSARRRSGANGESAPSGEETTAEAETTTPANTTSTSATYTSRAAKTRGSTEADDATPAQADAQLAMAFGILTKLIGDLLLQLTNHRAFAENKSEIGECLEVKEFEVLEVIMKDIQGRFVHVWQWLERVLDRVEAQLRFGNSIMSSSVSHMLKSHEEKKDEGDRKHRGKSVTVAGRRVEVNTRKSSSSDEPASNRKDFMTYMLTLMRGHSSENGDELPCIEIATLKPVAMVAEAYLYMHNVMDKLTTRVEEYRRDNDEMDVDVVASPNGDDPNPALQSQRKFFRRSNSISFPGMSYHDAHHVFKYATEQVLPLAVRPYLLHPNVEKMEIFEMSHPLRSRKDHLAKSKEHGNALPNYQGLVNPPTQCEQLLGGTTEQQIPKGARRVTINESSTNSPTPAVDCLTVADVLSTEGSPMNSPAQKRLDRWYLSLMLVSRAFHQDLLNSCGGDFPSSVLLRELSGFSIRDTHFRKQMEKYKSVQTRDLTLEVVRERHTLIAQTIRQINSQYTRYSSSNSTSASGSSASRPTLVIGRRIAAIQSSNSEAANNSPPLAVHKVKVTFRDEPGEGSGVARSFYSAFAEALAQMTHLPVMRNPTGSGGDAPAAPPAPGSQVNEIDDCKPLFFKPAKSGFWSPNPGTLSSGRINAFRNVGRIIGICLVQTEIFPFNLCRHVLKFILGRPITWYDLAFYDPELFNSLRNLIFNDEDDGDQTAEYYDLLSLSFSLDDPHEAGALIHLKPGGENIPVTKENVVEYLYLFVQDRLLGRHLQCLEAMRQGVFDVLPPNALDALTAEDLRLILCGAQEVSMSLMQSYTVWHNESQATNEEQEKFKQWFWSITSKFTQQEKQDLIFFWTGSPTLPSSEESFQPAPSIMLRPTDNQHLPTANTCISRLYLPHYSSKRVLRSKLLLAIKTRNFGFV
ncbi:hypothetical protein L596_010889 [Steinernema carpocapsae]|uniref:UBR-type domain-containing protein n=1 Tax=Steinernema carpocapsae TaxID=34508 RepID=A0A4U5PKL0_STECR|nr:hypothetical protein L596_010889 [Steinernema carpocapsae]